MTKKYLMKPLVFVTLFFGIATVIFCVEQRIAINFREEKRTEVKIESLQTPLKIISADIPIIKIGDETVYYPEFEFHLLATKKDYEIMLGRDVWSVTRNGRSIEELLKTDIIEEIARIKILVNEAKKEGCSLTKAEEEEIRKTAKTQIKGIDPLLKAKYYLDESLITGIYMENFLATKFFREYSKKKGAEGEKAKLLFNMAYNNWESIYTAEIYWENIDRIDIDGL